MAKKIDGYIKLNIPAGAANPSPPVGPALGQRGVNIMEFCKAFNASTESLEKNMPIPVVITVFFLTRVLVLLLRHHLFLFTLKRPQVKKKVLANLEELLVVL